MHIGPSLALGTQPRPRPPVIGGLTPNHGPIAGGTVITITGSGFLAGAIVLLGLLPALGVVVVNDTTITCTTPLGVLGAVAIIIINAGGLSVTLNAGFTFTLL